MRPYMKVWQNTSTLPPPPPPPTPPLLCIGYEPLFEEQSQEQKTTGVEESEWEEGGRGRKGAAGHYDRKL